MPAMRCPACHSVFTIYLRPTLLHCQACGKTTKLAKPKPKPKPPVK